MLLETIYSPKPRHVLKALTQMVLVPVLGMVTVDRLSHREKAL
jgi:hypothetical protein